MGTWRNLVAVGCLLAAVVWGQAQTCTLGETVQPGDCFQVKLEMKLNGEMRIPRSGSVVPLKMEAISTHEFPERVLAVGTTNLIEKSARVYDQANAVIIIGNDRIEKTLRPERKLIVAQRQRDQALVYSPTGALLRRELDLTSDHFDTLCLPGLLPGRQVAVGDTWKVLSNAVQGLCNFEGVTEQNLSGKLDEVKGETALFSVTGTASGIDTGALVKVTIDARGQFDLKSKRIVALEWNQKDDREAGPVNPATAVQIKVAMKRTPAELPDRLSDAALVSVPDDKTPVPLSLTQLEYHDAKGRFDMLHGREWQTVSQTSDRLILRLMERGDFVAQVTITPWTSAGGKGKHMTPEEFKKAMNATPGWEPEKELQTGEVPGTEKGKWIYRLSMLGQLDGLAVLQNFYLLAGPDGEQVVVVFTMTPKQADKLGARDLALVGSMDVPSPARK
jgi:hypothetical protein